MKCIAIILSGGTGSRMNMDIPKQYIDVGGRMIITRSMSPFWECDKISSIQIVADEAWKASILKEYAEDSKNTVNLSRGKDMNVECSKEAKLYKFNGFSLPGANRQLSILNALRDIRQDMEDDDIVIIHDAARPLVTGRMIEECIEAICGNALAAWADKTETADKQNCVRIVHDGVMPVIPMKDTVYYSEDGVGISKLLERDRIFAGQAPEVFRYGKYLNACERLLPDKIMGIRGSTEPAIMAGMDVVMIPGDERNFKITTKEDLERYIDIVKGIETSV